MPRVAIVTNYVSDYRYPVFRRLADSGELDLRIFLLSPLEQSTQRAREKLPLARSRALNLWFTIRHREVNTTQREQLPIPIGLLKDLLAFRPDVIITGNFGLHSLLCLAFSRIFRIPFVLWSEETIQSVRGRTGVQRWLRKFFARQVDAFLAWGMPAANYVRSLGVEPSRLYKCHQAVENAYWMAASRALDAEQERAALGFKGTVFLLVGKLIPRKGYINFLEAWASLPVQMRSRATAVFVGDGTQAAQLRQFVRDRKLDNVLFLGARAPSELVRYYTAADVFVFPSLEDVWGMVVNEALCCGLPVLASKFAGASQELVEGKDTGEVFDPTDSASFTRHLLRWIESPPQISSEVCRSVVAPLNPENSADTIASMLRSLTRRSGGLPAALPAVADEQSTKRNVI